MRNYTIAAVLVGSFLIFSPVLAAVEISDGSVKALYHLEDTVDSSGNGNNLTNNNSVTFSAGKLSNGATTGASNSTKDLVKASSLGIVTTTTINVWYKNITAVNGDGSDVLALYSNTVPRRKFQIYSWNDGTTHTRFSSGSSADDNCGVNVTHTLSTSDYEMLTVTYNGSTVEGFINGVSQGTNSCSGTQGSGSDFFAIFSRNSQAATYASGYADEVLVVDKVLSTSTIAALYNSGAGAEVCVTVGCATPSSTPSSTTWTQIMSTSTDAAIGNTFNFILFLIQGGIVVIAGYIVYKLIHG